MFSALCVFFFLESLSKQRFCHHGRQPEINRTVTDGEWWRQLFLFKINNGSWWGLPFLISNKNNWHHHSPSVTVRFTSGWRPCWQKRRFFKLSIFCMRESLFSVRPSVRPSIRLSVFLYIIPSVCPYFYPSVLPSVRPSSIGLRISQYASIITLCYTPRRSSAHMTRVCRITVKY